MYSANTPRSPSRALLSIGITAISGRDYPVWAAAEGVSREENAAVITHPDSVQHRISPRTSRCACGGASPPHARVVGALRDEGGGGVRTQCVPSRPTPTPPPHCSSQAACHGGMWWMRGRVLAVQATRARHGAAIIPPHLRAGRVASLLASHPCCVWWPRSRQHKLWSLSLRRRGATSPLQSEPLRHVHDAQPHVTCRVPCSCCGARCGLSVGGLRVTRDSRHGGWGSAEVYCPRHLFDATGDLARSPSPPARVV
jgi:hypothetical protein